jgi:hypothetical protein
MMRRRIARFPWFLLFLLLALPGARAQSSANSEAPVPVGYENDVYCFGYVGAPSEKFSGVIISADAIAEQVDYFEGDVIYADSPGGVRAGDEYWLLSPQEELLDPSTGDDLGMFYQYRGRARALCVKGEVSILQIVFACTDIPRGTMLKPFEPIPVPLARHTLAMGICDDPNGKRVGHIVYSRDGVYGLAAGYDVIVNMGADANLSPGDFLTVFRYSVPPEADISTTGQLYAMRTDIAFPRTLLGEAAVLTVGDHTSTVRITGSQRSMEVGDLVEIK